MIIRHQFSDAYLTPYVRFIFRDVAKDRESNLEDVRLRFIPYLCMNLLAVLPLMLKPFN